MGVQLLKNSQEVLLSRNSYFFYFRASKSTSENTITFGQESDYTGPLGNTMKVVAQRNGDVITANPMDVDIKLELVGGKAVETFTAKGKVWTRTSEKC